MWPWDHLVFGYLLHWPVARLWGPTARGDGPVLALALATQFPDLVDKPLAWEFHVLPSGLSLAHSLFFAVPVSLAVGALAARRGRPAVGVAFGVGYASHLLGDVFYNSAFGGELSWTFLVWPLVERHRDRESFGSVLGELLADFAGFLATPRGLVYLGVEAGVLLLAFALWRAEGYPGVGALASAVRSLTGRSQRGES